MTGQLESKKRKKIRLLDDFVEYLTDWSAILWVCICESETVTSAYTIYNYSNNVLLIIFTILDSGSTIVLFFAKLSTVLYINDVYTECRGWDIHNCQLFQIVPLTYKSCYLNNADIYLLG